MSTKLSLREARARQGVAKAKSPEPSVSPTQSFLLTAHSLGEPVKLAKALVGFGLTLKRAHGAVDKLASGERVIVDLTTDSAKEAIARLVRFGLRVSKVFRVAPVDAKKIRESQNLSQSEFAKRYGLDERTLQNWEQHRYEPDTPAKVLLTIIERNPDMVMETLYGVSPKPRR
jgi:DNA-binding transcriptional regulator YiaG